MKLSNTSSFTKVRRGTLEEKRKLRRPFETSDARDGVDKQIRCLSKVTEHIVDLYKRCNGKITILDSRPQRFLTNPSIPGSNPFDNTDGNLIVKVNDKIESPEGFSYSVVDLLGVGTFGQVFRCYKDNTREHVAIKVIKNIPAYYNQGLIEVKIVNTMNKMFDPNNQRHIVRLLESFEYRSHVCLVFELLHSSLLDVLTQNQYRGLPLTIIQSIARQLLIALVTLQDANIIHCDVKPENILLVPREPRNQRSAHADQSTNTQRRENTTSVTSSLTTNIMSALKEGDPLSSGAGFQSVKEENPRASISSDIKLIDFGSACLEESTVFSYIQSRFYRAPEVLLGVPYNGAIDVWSFACVCVELYLGLPLFPGVSQHNQLTRIVEMFGQPPDSLISIGKNSSKYFVRLSSSLDTSYHGHQSTHGSTVSEITTNSASSGSGTPSQYRLKTAEEYAKDTNTEVPVLKKYLRYSRLEEVIMKCSLPGKSRSWTVEQKQEEYRNRQSFLDFLSGMFRLHPFDRWTAKQAASHPFITNAPFMGPYNPPPDQKTNERKLSFMTYTQNDASKVKPTIRNRISGSIPHPIQQNQSPQLRSQATSQFPSSHEFLPLDRRRLSDPTNTSYLQSTLFNSQSLSTNQYGVMGSLKPDQSRPMLKRGQPVLPRREEVNEQGLNMKSSDAFKRQNSSGSLDRQHERQLWIMSSNQETQQDYRRGYNPDASIHQSQAYSHQGSWQNKSAYEGIGQASEFYPPHTSTYGNLPAKPYEKADTVVDSSMHHRAHPNFSMLSSSYYPSMSYSMSRAGGSMQDNNRNHIVLTDFGQALMRPDMDERRRLQSINTPASQPYSPQMSHHYPMGNHQYTPTDTYAHRYMTGTTMSSSGRAQYSFSNRNDGNYLSSEFQSMLPTNQATMNQISQSYHTPYGSMSASAMPPAMPYAYQEQSSFTHNQPGEAPISSSFHHFANQEASQRDNPLHSGYGFEHLTSENIHRHDDDANEEDLIEAGALKDAQIVADWDPFFQIDDVPNVGTYDSIQAAFDDQKDINDYL